jgi:hypothetical protein
VDDGRIKQLSDEVMAQLGRDEASPKPAAPARASVVVNLTVIHPSHQLLDVPSGSSDGRCVLDPSRPCVQSGQCRSLGH